MRSPVLEAVALQPLRHLQRARRGRRDRWCARSALRPSATRSRGCRAGAPRDRAILWQSSGHSCISPSIAILPKCNWTNCAVDVAFVQRIASSAAGLAQRADDGHAGRPQCGHARAERHAAGREMQISDRRRGMDAQPAPRRTDASQFARGGRARTRPAKPESRTARFRGIDPHRARSRPAARSCSRCASRTTTASTLRRSGSGAASNASSPW